MANNELKFTFSNIYVILYSNNELNIFMAILGKIHKIWISIKQKTSHAISGDQLNT